MTKSKRGVHRRTNTRQGFQRRSKCASKGRRRRCNIIFFLKKTCSLLGLEFLPSLVLLLAPYLKWVQHTHSHGKMWTLGLGTCVFYKGSHLARWKAQTDLKLNISHLPIKVMFCIHKSMPEPVPFSSFLNEQVRQAMRGRYMDTTLKYMDPTLK